MLTKRTIIKISLSVALFLLLFFFFFLFPEGNRTLLRGIFTPEYATNTLRDNITHTGIGGYGALVLLSFIQVPATILSSASIQLFAGFAFDFPIALACCVAGTLMGSSLCYLLFRGKRPGKLLAPWFATDLRFPARAERVIPFLLLLYFLPNISYGAVCFLIATTGVSFLPYLLLTLLCALPNLCFWVTLGHLCPGTHWAILLGVGLVLSALLLFLTAKQTSILSKLHTFAAKAPYSSKTTATPPNPWVLLPLYAAVRIYYRLKGIRLRAVNHCGHQPEAPSIVLCNHGSFMDFLFAEKLLLPSRPNFVVARLYFYHKFLGGLLRKLGCFPKSMFALDLESTKNCLRVLKNGGVLAMMPEARLSTAGQFEDIQYGTYPFLKKSAVPIYTIKIGGNYLANPKWGKGPRRGSLVEAELEQLFTAEEVRELSVEQIKAAVEERLYYDDFQWLEQHPDLCYKSKNLAEGLENILSLCPGCGAKHRLRTQERTIFCEKCGPLTNMDDRYVFDPEFCFRNPAQWYHWQTQVLWQRIEKDPDYALERAVTLRLPSQDGRSLTRKAGEGRCVLNRKGLTYTGTKDGEDCQLHFPIDKIYRLLFGAGENFEVYQGSDIHYFIPQERRSAVEWYQTSMLLHDNPLPESSPK
ncbi:MAG: VTT domain-containing protein [Oscillospiraceae bacterium]|nr:VTT domain-containing protein [Oscillospiraceae bacterium]